MYLSCFISVMATSLASHSIATSRQVIFLLFRAVTSAPWSKKKWRISRRLYLQAMWRGVFPSSSFSSSVLNKRELSTILTVFKEPALTAKWRAVRPCISLEVTSAPFRINSSHASLKIIHEELRKQNMFGCCTCTSSVFSRFVTKPWSQRKP